MKRIFRLEIKVLVILILAISLSGCNILQNTDTTDDMEYAVDDADTSSVDGVIDLNTLVSGGDLGDSQEQINSGKDKQSLDVSSILSNIWEFRVVDVGQGDSIILHSTSAGVNNPEDIDGITIVFDAGEEKRATNISKVLDNMGVKTIDLLVATHPHVDHIGGMESIIKNYVIEEILMSATVTTSKTYESLILAMQEETDCAITMAEPGIRYEFNGLSIEIIGPSRSFASINDNSVVAVVTYGNVSMLLTGDAEFEAEKDYVEYYRDVDILKVGHHGNSVSSSDNMLDKFTPEVAVVSCGLHSKYGLPTQEILNKLHNRGIEVFVTDVSGDIIIRTDGESYSVETKNDSQVYYSSDMDSDVITDDKNDNMEDEITVTEVELGDAIPVDSGQSTEEDIIVYATSLNNQYHSTLNCRGLFLSRDTTEMLKSQAVAKGYNKCTKCWGN